MNKTPIIPDEQIIARAKTDFVKRAVTEVEGWIRGLHNPRLDVVHLAGTKHAICLDEKQEAVYFYHQKWLYCLVYRATVKELQMLHARTSNPNEVRVKTKPGEVRFQIANDGDFDLLKRIILSRT